MWDANSFAEFNRQSLVASRSRAMLSVKPHWFRSQGRRAAIANCREPQLIMRNCVQGRCPPCQPLRRSLSRLSELSPDRTGNLRIFLLSKPALSGTSDISIVRHPDPSNPSTTSVQRLLQHVEKGSQGAQ